MFLALTLLCTLSAASPVATIDARVSDDLRSVSGVLQLPPEWGGELIDPLALMPEAPDDRHLMRTFPGRPNTGQITWQPDGAGRWAFTATLPRRYGALGTTREGLMANGGWYPQPTSANAPLPIFDWTVNVQLPQGSVGALGDATGRDALSWSGTAERVALGVLRRGEITAMTGEYWSVDLLTPHKPRRRLARELAFNFDLAATPELPLHGAAIEGPLRRRLVRPGPGLAFISDRSFRLTHPLFSFHRVAVTRGMAAAWIDQPDPWIRDLAAAALGQRHDAQLDGLEAEDLLHTFKWIPQVRGLLNSATMPFYSEVLQRTHPSDRLADDLAEMLDPTAPGTVVVRQLDATYGEGVGQAVGWALIQGQDVRTAATQARVDPDWLLSWRVPYPEQDYILEVNRTEKTVSLTRVVYEEAPEETVTVRIDDEDRTHTGGATSITWTLDEPPRRVSLDPHRDLRQTSLYKDHWPARYALTLSAGITTINLTDGYILAAGGMSLRRSWDTHNRFRGVLYNSNTAVAIARLSWLHQEGRLKDGWSRPHRWSLWTATSLLKPSVTESGTLEPTWGTGTVYAWDTRVHSDFPVRGHRLSYSVAGGLVPGLGQHWLHTGPAAVGIVSPHPRVALAGKARAAGAFANSPHGNLSLRGGGAMRSLPYLPPCPSEEPPCQVLANQLVSGAFELRVAALRNVSVPLLLAWGSEMQLTAGLEGVVAQTIDGPTRALGLTTGITGIADIVGAEPYLGGITVGWPLLWSTNLENVGEGGWPQISLRWSQEF